MTPVFQQHSSNFSYHGVLTVSNYIRAANPQTVKKLPAMQETQVQTLGQEDPLEKGMATHFCMMEFLGSASGKEPVSQRDALRDADLIPGSGGFSGRGNGNPLQYSCLEDPRDWGAWWAAIYGVTQSQTRLK